MSTDYKLISFNLCPFVQRSVITLREKGVTGFEIQYIDLADKPDWFLELSPLGKVPILVVEDTVLFESAVINEYLEEAAPGPALHPADLLRKAHNRAWIEVGSELLRKCYGLFNAKDAGAVSKAATNVRGVLSLLEEALGDGPLFNGQDFSLVDAAVAPALQRLTWTEELVPTMSVLADTPKVAAWRDVLLARPSVQQSTVPEIKELFAGYLQHKSVLLD